MLILNSAGASLRGSYPGEPAVRGTLNLNGNSVFGWAAGKLVDLTINVTRTGTTAAMANVNANEGAARSMEADFIIDGSLNWAGGNVSVTNPLAISKIIVGSTGEFNITAAGATWGVGAGAPTSHFLIQNDGKVTLDTEGMATLKGDYTTTGLTRLDVGILDLGGLAEQTAGTFQLHDNTTVKVTGSEYALRIRAGGIEGQGTVDGNLTLGYEISPATVASISPGISGVNGGIGTLTITQSYHVFSSEANTLMDVVGDASYDKIVVQGAYAVLNGYLIIFKNPNYQPPLGTPPLPLITSNSLSGDFHQPVTIHFNDPWWTDGPPLFGGAKKDGNNYVFYVVRAGS